MMRVLHVIPSVALVHGGPSRALRQMEVALRRQGLEVFTATTDDDGPGRRLPVQAQEPGRHYARKWTDFYKVAPGLLIWLWRHVREHDVLHVHALFSFSSVAAAVVARWRGVPYVIRPLGTLASYGVSQRRPWLKRLSLRLVEGPVLRHAAAVHFTSEAEALDVAALGLPCRAVVIPLAVEALADIARMPDERCMNLLFLSRIDPKKNLEALLEATAILMHRGVPVTLRVAGSGAADYEQALRARATALLLQDRVCWLGEVDGDAKLAAWASADVFVLPSFTENFGIAAAEAMAAGLPCVLAQGVAIAAEAEAAGAAVVCPPDATALADALLQLWHDHDARIMMATRALAHARACFAPEVMAERLLGLYADLRRRHGAFV